MKRLIPIFLLFLFSFVTWTVSAQKVSPNGHVSDKKEIRIRPNSRDYGPNQRNNNYQRVENKRDGNMFINKRPVIPQIPNQQNNANLKNKQILKGRQINIIRRPL